MVLNSESNRGQIFIIMGLVISLSIITSALLLSQENRTQLERADGVSLQKPEAQAQLDDIRYSVETIIIRSNRGGSSGAIKNKIAGDSNSFNSYLQNISNYNRHSVNIHNIDRVEGERYYNRTRTHINDGEVIDVSGREFAGGMHIDVSNEAESGLQQVTTGNAATSNTLTIKTNSNTLYVYHPQSMASDVAVVTESNPTTPIGVNQTQTASLDLATGKLNGYNIPGYTPPTGSIRAENTTSDLVVTEEYVLENDVPPADRNDRLSETSATYAVDYDINIKTNNREIETTQVATHGPTTND